MSNIVINHLYFNDFYVPTNRKELIHFISKRKGGGYSKLTTKQLYAIYCEMRKGDIVHV